MSILIRERAPLRHDIEAETPSGGRYRWAADEPAPENTPSGLSFSSTMPGGFENLDVTLPRRPGRDYADLDELSMIRVRNVGEIVGEYRLQAAPSTAGDQMAITPQAVGWQAHLDDDQSAAMIYVDRDLTRWGPASAQRRLDMLTAGYSPIDPSTLPDPTTGVPVLGEEIPQQPWGTGGWPRAAAYYDAGPGLAIGSLDYAWQKNGNIDPADPNWVWQAALSDDDIDTTVDISGNLSSAGPGSGGMNAGGRRRFAYVEISYGAPSTGDSNAIYGLYWTRLAVYGDHGLPLPTLPDDSTVRGIYAPDVVAHAVGTWAPKLKFTTGTDGTIQPFTGFVIPHMTFLEPTTASEIIKQASRFDLADWAVWEGPTFYWNQRNARGKTWRARVGPAQLQETGPSIDRLWNSVIVQYTDVAGATRSVGPPGSRADDIDAGLEDTDPDNPATRAGISRRSLLTMGTSTSTAASKVGAAFLYYQKVISNAGQARLVGHVEDDRGVLWPVSRVRAGDAIVFPDAADPSERRIVRAEYSDADKSCQIDLDAPPDALQALLERLSVTLTPLGLS